MKKVTLKELIGEHVRLVNDDDVQMDNNKLQIHVHGKLEYDDESYQFYVRINDDPRGHGCNGISFRDYHVIEVFRQPSGIGEITLR